MGSLLRASDRLGMSSHSQQCTSIEKTIVRINGVSARQLNGMPVIRQRGRRLEEPPRPDTGPIIAVSADVSRKKSPREARRTTGGRTSGESAPRGTGQAHGSKAETPVSSSKERAAKSGGARPGRGVGTSVGRRRWRRMRSITEASSISAINRRRPPHLGHASVSMPKLRRIKSAQSRASGRDGSSPCMGGGPASGAGALASPGSAVFPKPTTSGRHAARGPRMP